MAAVAFPGGVNPAKTNSYKEEVSRFVNIMANYFKQKTTSLPLK
jgi:hypothetical protein